MFRVVIISGFLFSIAALIGCGGGAVTNTANVANANANANTTIKLDPANMPPGLSASPVTPAANTPGIPANASPLPKGATPTPGIPSEAELKKPFKPGATPTPGIPSPEEIKKMLGKQTNTNAPPSTTSDVPMMKSTKRKLGGKPE